MFNPYDAVPPAPGPYDASGPQGPGVPVSGASGPVSGASGPVSAARGPGMAMLPVLTTGQLLPSGSQVQAIWGTNWGVAQLPLSRTPSGAAAGSLAAGLGALVLLPLVGLLARYATPPYFWALDVLAMLLGAGGLVVGLLATRQVRGRRHQISGLGVAVAGSVCGGSGLLIAAAVGVFFAVFALAG